MNPKLYTQFFRLSKLRPEDLGLGFQSVGFGSSLEFSKSLVLVV